jgi:cytochrome c oxidase assembly protein subunit 11
MAAPSRNLQVAFIAGGVAASMLGLAYASVPLYALFCQATGYGGTTQRADAAPENLGKRHFTIRFDANIASSLNWTFVPAQLTMRVLSGKSEIAAYKVTSLSGQATAGTAEFNVTPKLAGQYFNKIECFCFTEQKLEAHASAELPVMFFVDPDIEKDPDLQTLDEIVLSYTFYPAGEKPPGAETN